jgi:unsaturated rhamnogalacturonyl hydrolase
VKKGYIDKKYLSNAKKAYQGILKNLIKVHDNGVVDLTQVCAVAGLGGTPYRDGTYEYYIHEQKRDNDPKGVGPFIMLAVQFEELDKKQSK